ncbi:hypothetical protein ACQ9PX_25290, partial [Escherichia coli]|uniref:hypothetical protein n=1 Tax=Escherichia coli TaxID=562 RepID=UPI003FD423D1
TQCPAKVVKRTLVVTFNKKYIDEVKRLPFAIMPKNDRFLAPPNRTLSHCWKNSLGFSNRPS